MGVIYNEIDPFAAQWLRNLIARNLIEPGEVIETDILRLHASRLRDRVQAHFFAGIGVWSYALRLAGWPVEVPVWTGSCPCQPFSSAGRGKGVDDPRHLWPVWLRLIDECRPPVIFGEQVASPAGRGWLHSVQTDLEALGYRFGAADLCAAGVGAPHRRQRLFWVGISSGDGLQAHRIHLREWGSQQAVPEALGSGQDASRPTRGYWAQADWLDTVEGSKRPAEPGSFPLAHGVACRVAARVPEGSGQEAHEYNRRGALRGIGNAIVPQVAAEFVRSVIDILGFEPSSSGR